MGTAIELCIGSVSLAYAKNYMGKDYGFLFQGADLIHRKADPIDQDFPEKYAEEIAVFTVRDELFARTLSRIIPRLNMLGLTLENARAEYEANLSQAIEMETCSELEAPITNYLTFDEFCEFACRYPLAELEDRYIEYETPDRDLISQGRFADCIEIISRIPSDCNYDLYYSEASYFSARVCILSAESMLQIFALNSVNAELEVTWEFGPIVDAGWVPREAFFPCARRTQKLLIATEGASDTRIIKRSLEILCPDVADFFNFVDVDERHNFWGTGNLVKFAEGLLRIDTLNKVLFVFDNDAEGMDAFSKLMKLCLPMNMRAMLLPDLEEFRAFPTRGPEGVSTSDINGRAAAIECYLDLRLDHYPPPQVTWSNLKKDIDIWHGILDFKESYFKHFYDQPDDLLRNGEYDVSKLFKLVNALILQAGLVSPVA